MLKPQCNPEVAAKRLVPLSAAVGAGSVFTEGKQCCYRTFVL